MPANLDIAVGAATDVTTKAASGESWAFVVFFLIIISGLTGLAIWKRPRTSEDPERRHQPERRVHHEPDCDYDGGCPAVKQLSIKLDMLIEQMKEDREERVAHRDRIEQALATVHTRIDQILLTELRRA